MDEQQAQFLAAQLSGLWEGEFAATCKVLAAVPDGTRDYKPDDKSRTAWELATHLATADIWFLDSILSSNFVWDAEKVKQIEGQFTNVGEVVAYYEREFPAKLAAVRAMSPAALAASNSFFGMFSMPNVSFLGMANNHSVHHRGQLASYLRSMGAKVPAIYGGSADFPMAG
jgi:uncharacterized damage-inducible protein DinB